MSVDSIARGLAVRAGARSERARILDRLARGIARAGGRLPALATTLPTIGATAPSALAGTLVDIVANTAKFTLLRGPWVASNPTFPQNQFFIPQSTTGGNGTDAGVALNPGTGAVPLLRFWSDAPDLEILSYGMGGSGNGVGGYRLRVDGAYVATGVLAGNYTAGSGGYTRITWGDGSAANRAMRLYEIEGLSSFRFGGVKLPATSVVWPAPVPDALKIIAHGDSFLDGTGSTHTALQPSMPGQLALLLGQPNMAASGVGGTGYIANSNGTRNRFGQRVQPDIIAKAPDVVIELGGINDEGFVAGDNGAAFQAAVIDWLRLVTSALPNVLIFMTGPMSQGNPGSNRRIVRDAKQAAAAQFPNNVVFIDNIAENWVTGTGRTGAPAGNGNADWVTGGTTGNDTVHMADGGHAYIPHRVVQAVARGLATA